MAFRALRFALLKKRKHIYGGEPAQAFHLFPFSCTQKSAFFDYSKKCRVCMFIFHKHILNTGFLLKLGKDML
jgi:hypothetical protein